MLIQLMSKSRLLDKGAKLSQISFSAKLMFISFSTKLMSILDVEVFGRRYIMFLEKEPFLTKLDLRLCRLTTDLEYDVSVALETEVSALETTDF